MVTIDYAAKRNLYSAPWHEAWQAQSISTIQLPSLPETYAVIRFYYYPCSTLAPSDCEVVSCELS
jgi:hypothetical protein